MNKNRKLVTEDTYYMTKTASGSSQVEPFHMTHGEAVSDKDRLTFYMYTNPFTNSSQFSEKRFERYVTKVADVLLEFSRKLYPNQRIYNLNEWYIEVLNYYFKIHVFGENKPNYSYDITNLANTYAVPFSVLFENTKKNLTGYISEPYNKDNLSINEIITSELYNACKKYLAGKAVTETGLNQGNYIVRGIPETAMEKLKLLEDILNRCIVSIERICNNELTVIMNEFVSDNSVMLLMHENEAKDLRIKELEKENELIRFQAHEEKKQKEKAWKSLSESTNSQKLKELSQAYHQLAKQHVQLQKKYNELLEKSQHKLSVLKRAKKKQPKVDSSGNYVFLVNSDLRMTKRIMAEFPNSRIISGNKKISIENADMVIAMTRSISHAWYYGVKKQCKTKDIPFIHCPSTNMDELKLLICKNSQ